jgi:Sulfotransferase domain
MSVEGFIRYSKNYAESLILGGLYPLAWKGEGSSRMKKMLRYRYAMAEFEGMSPAIRKYVRGKIPNPKYISVLEFPKCGRTYLRFMVSHVLSTTYSIPFKYAIFDPIMPEYGLPIFRYIHGFSESGHYTDNYISVGKTGLFQSVGIVLLYRDPLRVMISYFHHCRDRSGQFQGRFKNFIRDESLGIFRYASYIAHYKQEAQNQNGLILKYEDIVSEPAEKLREILKFAKIPFDETAIASSVALSRFTMMKEFVSSRSNLPTWLIPTTTNPQSHKVRDGGQASLSDYYDIDDIQFVDSVWKSFGNLDYGENFDDAAQQISEHSTKAVHLR